MARTNPEIRETTDRHVVILDTHEHLDEVPLEEATEDMATEEIPFPSVYEDSDSALSTPPVEEITAVSCGLPDCQCRLGFENAHQLYEHVLRVVEHTGPVRFPEIPENWRDAP